MNSEVPADVGIVKMFVFSSNSNFVFRITNTEIPVRFLFSAESQLTMIPTRRAKNFATAQKPIRDTERSQMAAYS